MDLRLYSRVIWRFRYLVLGGLVVAMVLAFLATFHVGPHGVSYRQQKTYRATQTLWLTSKGSLFDASKQANLAQVAVQYVNIANSDIVLSRVLKVGGRVPGAYAVVQVPGPNNSLQPVIAVSGVSHAPGQAVSIADRISEALRWWSDRSQNQQAVSADQRVQVDTISRARPVLFEGRKLTVPIIIFLSVLIVTFGLVFILENLRPRPPARPSRREREPLTPDYGEEGEPLGRTRGIEPDDNGDGDGVPEGTPAAQPAVPHRSE